MLIYLYMLIFFYAFYAYLLIYHQSTMTRTDPRALFPVLLPPFAVKVGDSTTKGRGHVPDHNGSFNGSRLGDNGYA